MALYETRYIEESWTLSTSWHGLCSCGKKFPLDNNEIAVSWFRPDSRTSMKPCPYCGAPYGNQALRIDMRNWQYGHTNLEVKDIKDKVALFSLSREGDIVTLDRKVVAEKEFTSSTFLLPPQAGSGLILGGVCELRTSKSMGSRSKSTQAT